MSVLTRKAPQRIAAKVPKHELDESIRLDQVMLENKLGGLLEERSARYGCFASQAKISQDLKSVMQETQKWGDLDASKKEALLMIQNKIARILNGDSSCKDSWVDIAGYAMLVADELK